MENQQSLMILWDTDGSQWFSESETSVPKPCLISGSSSDQGFFVDIATVFIVIVAWIYLFIDDNFHPDINWNNVF